MHGLNLRSFFCLGSQLVMSGWWALGRLLFISWWGEVPVGFPEPLCGVDIGQHELYASTFCQEESDVSRFSVRLVAELGVSAFVMRAFHEVVDRSFET